MTPADKDTPPLPEGGGSFTLKDGKYVREPHEDDAPPAKPKKESR